MTDCQLADEQSDTPYVILEDDEFELWTEFDGSRVWWQHRSSRDQYPVWGYWLCEKQTNNERDQDIHRIWTLLDLAECSPAYDDCDFPSTPSLNEVHAAFAAQRIFRDPRRKKDMAVVKIYCYQKPNQGIDHIVGVATDEKGEVILEHPSDTVADIKPAMGFGTAYQHHAYDDKYGRGNWELIWLADPGMHPKNRPQNPPQNQAAPLPTPVPAAPAAVAPASEPVPAAQATTQVQQEVVPTGPATA